MPGAYPPGMEPPPQAPAAVPKPASGFDLGPGAFPPGAFPAGAFPDGMDENAPDSPRVKCEGCGRSFRSAAMEKHAKICKKVFQEKRKAFDSAANRLEGQENAQRLIQNAHKVQAEAKAVAESGEPVGAGGGGGGGTKASGKASVKGAEEDSGKPMPAWKKKSLEFRAAILAKKAEDGDQKAAQELAEMNKELQSAPKTVDPNMFQCPHCGRTFNKEAGERHVAICLKTFGGKNKQLVKGGGSNCNATAKAGAAAAATERPQRAQAATVAMSSGGVAAATAGGARNRGTSASRTQGVSSATTAGGGGLGANVVTPDVTAKPGRPPQIRRSGSRGPRG